jgi:pimeloyl-ACP methyl ester carboxylesterase
MTEASPFKSVEGEAAFLAAYDAALKLWPVPYEELDLPTRFGVTHVIACGPKDAPPLVLLHGFMATSVSWAPNVADFAVRHRVYAVDVMGQPGKSIPGEPIGNPSDYVAWLTDTFDALDLRRACLAGTSFGGQVALMFAIAAPKRVTSLVLLSPGGLLPLVRQFRLRAMLMGFLPSRLTVNSFMRWIGLTDAPGELDASPVINLMYLGQKHFRVPPETLRAGAVALDGLSDDELRAVRVPVLALVGADEVINAARAALPRARRLIPGFESDLIPGCKHDMCFSQHRVVDARVLDFLNRTSERAQPQHRSIA